MTPEQEKQVRDVVQALWAHDPWMYGFTCVELLNKEIDFSAPAIVKPDGGRDKNGIEYIEARVMADGKEFEINYRYGGWSLGFVTPDKARLTMRAPDALCDCYVSVPAGNYPDLCAHCGKKARR